MDKANYIMSLGCWPMMVFGIRMSSMEEVRSITRVPRLYRVPLTIVLSMESNDIGLSTKVSLILCR